MKGKDDIHKAILFNVSQLWEIDLYCRADDCSRPEIFNEVSIKTIFLMKTNLKLLNVLAQISTYSTNW